jgi:hypothetical protein
MLIQLVILLYMFKITTYNPKTKNTDMTMDNVDSDDSVDNDDDDDVCSPKSARSPYVDVDEELYSR